MLIKGCENYAKIGCEKGCVAKYFVGTYQQHRSNTSTNAFTFLRWWNLIFFGL
jgi:hypothetical protein